MSRWCYAAFAVIAAALVASAQNRSSYGPNHTWWDAGRDDMLPWAEDYENENGQIRVFNANGAVRTKGHPFFEALGSNGRACVTCHQPFNAMSVSAATVRTRWDETEGKDPLFAAIDGSNCPDLDQTTRDAHSLVLNRGLFRIALPWPLKGAEIHIEVVKDPTGCNTGSRFGLSAANPEISVYRRPRIAANLGRLINGPAGAVLMADGREPTLRAQAITAALVHEQADAQPTSDQLRGILDFETQVFAAQHSDLRAGLLNEQDGPVLLGADRIATKTPSWSPDSSAWLTFASWSQPSDQRTSGVQREFRASVARGSQVFATRLFKVNGANRTCASCHTPGTARWMDIGTTNHAIAESSPDLPLFKVTCASTAVPHPVYGRVIFTQDPGRALVSGKCQDVGSVVLPQFRGLAARAPYFSNGAARTLPEVVEHYNRRYSASFTESEKLDLVNFLKVL